jgi:alkylation response protein AidB-like acyl-CoA dehydrogenase
MTHGGMGYAKEYHVERLFREVMIARIAPVSPPTHPLQHRGEGVGDAEEY